MFEFPLMIRPSLQTTDSPINFGIHRTDKNKACSVDQWNDKKTKIRLNILIWDSYPTEIRFAEIKMQNMDKMPI